MVKARAGSVYALPSMVISESPPACTPSRAALMTGQPQSLAGQPISVRGRSAAKLSAAVGSQIAVANVVSEDENEVRLLRRCAAAGVLATVTMATEASKPSQVRLVIHRRKLPTRGPKQVTPKCALCPILCSVQVFGCRHDSDGFAKGRDFRMAWIGSEANLDRGPHHPGQDIEARESLPARSVRAGSLGCAREGEADQMGGPRALVRLSHHVFE
jgi:hypothetical protein